APARHRGAARAAPARAFRRAAAARRARPGARPASARLPARRAAVESRCAAAARDAGGAEASARRVRDHDGLRHARPGGGDGAFGSRRGAECRPRRAVRAAARALPQAREPVRRGLRRQPADQRARRAARRGSRAAGRRLGGRYRRRRAARRRPRESRVRRRGRARRRGAADRADRRRRLGRRADRRAADHGPRATGRRPGAGQHGALRPRARAAASVRSIERPALGIGLSAPVRWPIVVGEWHVDCNATGPSQARRGAARPAWRPRDKEVEMFRRFARHLPLTILVPLASLAQPVEDDEGGTPLSMEEVIVTGTASPERTKYESSIPITTFEADDLLREAPQSTADLLESVPGFWVESTSGETQGNVFARGIIQDGGYRYVGLMEDGLPLYPVYELSFYNPDQFVRLDRTIRRVEVVRGGTAPIFSSGAVGGTINFIDRKSVV